MTSARRRARRIEWLLLATLLPLYLATQVGLVKAYRASDGRVVPLRVSPAQGADGASRLQSMTRELCASIALDETTRERAGHVCADFVRHASSAIRGGRSAWTSSRCPGSRPGIGRHEAGLPWRDLLRGASLVPPLTVAAAS